MLKRTKIAVVLLVMLSVLAGTALASDTVIYGDRIGIFRNINIHNDVNMRGDAISIFGNVKVNGNLRGDAVAVFGSVEVNGTVDGSVVSIFGRIDMGQGATITRDKVQIIGGVGRRGEASRVMGDEINVMRFNNFIPGLWGLAVFLMILVAIKTIISFIFSLILVSAAPERMDKIASSLSVNLPKKFGIGFLVMVVYWLFIPLSAAIVIGIPLIPIAMILMTFAGFAGNTAIKLAIGRKIGKGKEWSNITQLIVGTIIYLLAEITLVLKPVLYLAKIASIGAIADTRIGTVDYYSQDKTKDTPAYNVIDSKDKNEDTNKDSNIDDNKKEE